MIAALIRFFVGLQSCWVGCEPSTKQRIYFANHGSNLDGPSIWACLPAEVREHTRIVAARDYWDAKAWRRYVATKIFHAILINRKKITREDNPLEQMCQALTNEHCSIIIFPEGTRKDIDHEDEILPFKAGLHRMAERFPNIELIPVYLRNLDRILPKGEHLPVPVVSSVVFGEPLQRIENEDKHEFLKRAADAILHLKSQEDR